MDPKTPLFRGIPNRSNIFARIVEMALFVGFETAIGISLLHETAFPDQLIKGVILAVVVLFQLFHFYRLYKEPSFYSVYPDRVIVRHAVYLLRKEIPVSEIKGFSSIKRPYFVQKGRVKLEYNAYLIYLTNGKKILLTDFYVQNFNLLSQALRKSGIPFLGKEDGEWTYLRKRFTFDRNTN